MKLKSTLALLTVVLATAASGSVFAHHRSGHHRAYAPPHTHSYVAPRSGSDVTFGFSVGAPAYYYYEPAPRYYYYEPAPTYYYYEPAPSYYYSTPGYSYYYDSSPTFPYTNSRD